MNARPVWTIDPLRRVGPILFGMSIDAVRVAVDARAEPFHKGGRREHSDDFGDLGVHVHYDGGARCEAVEVFSTGQVQPALNGLNLLSAPYAEVERRIREIDAGTKLQLSGLVSLRCGVGIYVDRPPDEGDAQACSVIAFKAGYFDGAMQALDTLARP